MFVNYAQNQSFLNTTTQPTKLTAGRVAVFAGLLLGGLFTLLMPQISGLVALALWPLGMAIALLAVGLWSKRRPGATQWGFLLLGQILGVTAVAMLFIAQIA